MWIYISIKDAQMEVRQRRYAAGLYVRIQKTDSDVFDQLTKGIGKTKSSVIRSMISEYIESKLSVNNESK
jgi:hypothetical protein